MNNNVSCKNCGIQFEMDESFNGCCSLECFEEKQQKEESEHEYSSIAFWDWT
jgi:hypothetical protein